MAERYELASDDFSQCLRLQPDDPSALSSRAAAYLLTSQPERAIPDLDKAIELTPEDQRADLYRQRGMTFAKLGRFDLTERDMAEYLRLAGDSASETATEQDGEESLISWRKVVPFDVPAN